MCSVSNDGLFVCLAGIRPNTREMSNNGILYRASFQTENKGESRCLHNPGSLYIKFGLLIPAAKKEGRETEQFREEVGKQNKTKQNRIKHNKARNR